MRSLFGLAIIVVASLIVGVLLGWSFFYKREIKQDREVLIGILEDHEKVKNATIHINDETRDLYYRINKALENYPTKPGDSIADILHHTSAVMNKYLSMNDLINDVYKTDSIILKQHFKVE